MVLTDRVALSMLRTPKPRAKEVLEKLVKLRSDIENEVHQFITSATNIRSLGKSASDSCRISF